MSRQSFRFDQFWMNGRANAIRLWERVVGAQENEGLLRWRAWFELDRAIVWGVLARVWRLGAGPATALLIAVRFTPELQGYYYTFSSLLALQVFVELGLGTVIIQFASHEWSLLGFDQHGRIVGNPAALSRLSSLAQVALRWYTVAAGIAAIGLGLGGWAFFSMQYQAGIEWRGPWLALCALTAVRLFLVPIWSLLEGCNQVAAVYAFRLLQAMLNNLALWSALLLNARLWTVPAAAALDLAWSVLFLWSRFRPFVGSLATSPQGPRVRWRAEVWPMQWRIALTWLSGYLVFSFFTPVLFHFHGPVVAGQVGMTMSLINMLSAIAYTFIAARVPRFGMLIAQRAYGILDRLFLRSVLSSLVVASAGAIITLTCVAGLGLLGHPLAERLLPLAPTLLFCLAMVLSQITFAMAAYLRAHRQEPYLQLLVLQAIAAAVLTVVLGKSFSAPGVAVGFLAVNGVTLVPAGLVFFRCRAEWHAQPQVTGLG